MSVYFDEFLSNQQCGFWKGYTTQHCLLNLLEKWKNSVDKGKSLRALLTDLSKTFDRLHHELLSAKLNPYDLLETAIQRCFYEKAFLKICSKFTGKQQCRSTTSTKLQSNFIEITLRHGWSIVNLLHISRTLFYIKTLEWLPQIYSTCITINLWLLIKQKIKNKDWWEL